MCSFNSYYQPKTEPTLRLKVGGGNLIQHSTPVVELRSPFIPVDLILRIENFFKTILLFL